MIRFKETKEYFKMKFRVKEEEDDAVDEIKELILTLKNNNFGNAEKRKEFVKIISQIALSNDPQSRKVIKALGNFMSSYNIGDIEVEVDSDGNAELEIKSKQNEGNVIMKKKIQFKSKHMKEMYGDMMDDMGYDVVDDFADEEEGFSDDFSDDTLIDEPIIDDFADEDEFIDDDEFIDNDFDDEDDFIDDTIDMDDEFIDDDFSDDTFV